MTTTEINSSRTKRQFGVDRGMQRNMFLALMVINSDNSCLLCHWYLTIGGEQEMCSILLWQPSDLVDLFFNLQALQVVKVWLMALECAIDIVLPRVHRLPHLLWFAVRLKYALAI